MKLIIAAVVGSVVAVGVLIYLLIAPTAPNIVPDDTSPRFDEMTPVVSTLPLQGQDTLRSLLARSESLECSIEYTDLASAVAVTGTYFVAEGQLRGDFITMVDDMEVVASMIQSDTTFYTWSEVMGVRYGMQVDLTKVSLSDPNQPDTREPVPLDAVVQYDCRQWQNVDRSVFMPPSDIIFQDYGALIERGMEAPVLYE